MTPIKTLLSLAKSLVRVAIGVYIGFAVILFFFQRNILYHPDARPFASCPAFSEDERIEANGTRAYVRHADGGGDALFVFYHGNGGNACDRAFLRQIPVSLGYDALFVEYTGYAGDSRKPTQDLLLADARNIHAYAQKMGYTTVVVAGESLGGTVAAYHNSLGGVDALVLLETFDSVEAVASDRYPIYPARWLVREKYDAAKWAHNAKRALSIHGTKDSIIPFARGKSLFESLETADKEFVSIDGAGHNDLYEFGQTTDALSKFLAAAAK